MAERPRGHDGLAARVRRAFYNLRTEHTSAGRESAAIGVGVFIGCTPFFGFHLLICWAAAAVLRLNRVYVYLAANISNPVFAPFLIVSELQTGAWLRRGAFQSLTLPAIRAANLQSFGLDYLLGAVVVGVVLGAVSAAGTYAAHRGPADDPEFAALIRRASDRYVATSITAWEFARGKLRGDPIYRHALCRDLLPSGRVLVDVGCGQGLMLALLADARGSSSRPQYDRLIGIEVRPRVARLARRALRSDAEILEQDAQSIASGSTAIAPCSAVLFFDVLHLMPAHDQEAIVRTMAAALEAGGVILVRDADASAGWRFAAVRAGNRLKAVLSGAWRRPFHFRTRREWIECFVRLGLDVDVRPMGDGTPFANVLFRLTVRDPRSTS